MYNYDRCYHYSLLLLSNINTNLLVIVPNEFLLSLVILLNLLWLNVVVQFDIFLKIWLLIFMSSTEYKKDEWKYYGRKLLQI